MRVVSLVPSVTETLLACGVTPVACTRFCEQPGIPAVGGTKNPDVEAIIALAPDLVVMNDEENRAEDALAVEAAGLAVHVVSVRTVEDVAPQLAALASRVGARCPPLSLPPPRPLRVRAFVPIWRRPWMSLNGSTYGSSLLQRVGVQNVLAHTPVRYPEVTLEEVVALEPDVVLAPSEPYPFSERHRDELERVAPVRFVDGRDLFWWGARTPAAVASLAAALGDL